MGRNRDMASRSKAAHSERKRPKSTLILTVNYPIYPCCKATSRLPHKPIRSAQWQTVYFFKSCSPSRLIDWYLIRLLLDSLVFLYLVFYCAGFSPCGFSMCGFATSGLSPCGYSPCGGTENTWFALRAACSYAGISEYGKPFKSRLQRKKMPKIYPYPDSKSSCLPAHLRQRKPPVPQTVYRGQRDRRFGFSDCSCTDDFVSFFIQGCHSGYS